MIHDKRYGKDAVDPAAMLQTILHDAADSTACKNAIFNDAVIPTA